LFLRGNAFGPQSALREIARPQKGTPVSSNRDGVVGEPCASRPVFPRNSAGTGIAMGPIVSRRFLLFVLGLACAIAPSIIACIEGSPPTGGANPNEHRAGDQPGGVVVAHGEIAIAPRGDYLLFAVGDSLETVSSAGGPAARLPVVAPSRVSFNKDGSTIYVASLYGTLHAIDVATRTEKWSRPIATGDSEQLRLGISPSDGRVLAVAGRTIHSFDAATGVEHQLPALAQDVADLTILSDGRALIVQRETWAAARRPQTAIRILYPNSALSAEINVPNCAARLAVTHDEKRAFLAPTVCGTASSRVRIDPVSVIELPLGKEQFLRNLPGFGPVAIARSAPQAIAFVDAAIVDRALFDDPSQIPDVADGTRFFLMILDTTTLKFRLEKYGNSYPRYAITPDGKTVLVDSISTGWTFGDEPDVTTPVQIFRVPTRSYQDVSGVPFLLDAYVLTNDSKRALAIDDGLIDFKIELGVSQRISLDFTPTFLNLSPDERTLYLRDRERLCAFSLVDKRCTRFINLLP
jgi:hypothetical protein